MPSSEARDCHRVSFERALLGAFICFLTLPVLGFLLKIEPSSHIHERRILPPKPILRMASPQGLALYQHELEGYWSTHFGFRKFLIHCHGESLKLIGSLAENCILGVPPWLFEGNGYFQRPARLEKLRKSGAEFARLTAALDQKGIALVVAVTPRRTDVYPEKLPSRYAQFQAAILEGRTRTLDVLREGETPHTKVFDFIPAFKALKPVGLVYFRKDVHWTPRAGFAAFRKIEAFLTTRFPALKPIPDTDIVSEVISAGDSVSRSAAVSVDLDEVPFYKLNKQSWRYESGTWNTKGERTVTVSSDKSKPRALIIHDSQAEFQFPFLAEHFSRAEFYQVAKWSEFSSAHLRKARPDVIIILAWPFLGDGTVDWSRLIPDSKASL